MFQLTELAIHEVNIVKSLVRFITGIKLFSEMNYSSPQFLRLFL